MAKIHYWELSNYNKGDLIGKWFEVDGLTHDEHLDEINEWLEQLTEETGELCEEWIVGDTEGIPEQFVSEYSIDPKFFEVAEFAEQSRLSMDIILAGIQCGIELEDIKDKYIGEFKSEEDFGYEMANGEGLIDEALGNLASYFDYEAYGRDLMSSHYEQDGYYFHTI